MRREREVRQERAKRHFVSRLEERNGLPKSWRRIAQRKREEEERERSERKKRKMKRRENEVDEEERERWGRRRRWGNEMERRDGWKRDGERE